MKEGEMKRLTRDQYKVAMDSGSVFKEAYLYEPDHAPKNTVFLYVDLTKGYTKFVRVVKTSSYLDALLRG